eukprot:9404630-Alexandrium_andersonii.AAC.1
MQPMQFRLRQACGCERIRPETAPAAIAMASCSACCSPKLRRMGRAKPCLHRGPWSKSIDRVLLGLFDKSTKAEIEQRMEDESDEEVEDRQVAAIPDNQFNLLTFQFKFSGLKSAVV